MRNNSSIRRLSSTIKSVNEDMVDVERIPQYFGIMKNYSDAIQEHSDIIDGKLNSMHQEINGIFRKMKKQVNSIIANQNHDSLVKLYQDLYTLLVDLDTLIEDTSFDMRHEVGVLTNQVIKVYKDGESLGL